MSLFRKDVNDTDKIQGEEDPIKRLVILIDGSKKYGVKGLMCRMRDLEKLTRWLLVLFFLHFLGIDVDLFGMLARALLNGLGVAVIGGM